MQKCQDNRNKFERVKKMVFSIIKFLLHMWLITVFILGITMMSLIASGEIPIPFVLPFPLR